jgi:hypothetical protein
MNHILPYDSLNEAAAALPAMPAFLKAAGAKPEHVQFGGPRMNDQPANAWQLDVKAPYATNEIWELIFWPNGTFETHISPKNTKGPFKTTGTWKTDSASKFKIGNITLKGVAVKITSLMGSTTYM